MLRSWGLGRRRSIPPDAARRLGPAAVALVLVVPLAGAIAAPALGQKKERPSVDRLWGQYPLQPPAEPDRAPVPAPPPPPVDDDTDPPRAAVEDAAEGTSPLVVLAYVALGVGIAAVALALAVLLLPVLRARSRTDEPPDEGSRLDVLAGVTGALRPGRRAAGEADREAEPVGADRAERVPAGTEADGDRGGAAPRPEREEAPAARGGAATREPEEVARRPEVSEPATSPPPPAGEAPPEPPPTPARGNAATEPTVAASAAGAAAPPSPDRPVPAPARAGPRRVARERPAGRRPAPVPSSTAPELASTPAAWDVCEITWWHGSRKGGFDARAVGSGGHEQTVARSPTVRWASEEAPPQAGSIGAAHARLVQRLLEEGWEPYETGPTWYGGRFRRRGRASR